MTSTAATEKLIVTGTAGTLSLGNITADQIDTSGFTFITMGTLQQVTNFTGGSSAETIVGSTAADILNGELALTPRRYSRWWSSKCKRYHDWWSRF